MKRISKLVLALFVAVSLVACSQSTNDFKQVDISMSEVKEMIDKKESFAVMFERENCSFCESIQEYIEQTKNEHPGKTLYVVDTTDFGFSRETDTSDTLNSSTEDGNLLLEIAPYFMYTPTVYIFKEGKLVDAGVGFDEERKMINLAPLDAQIDFDKADALDFWEFITR